MVIVDTSVWVDYLRGVATDGTRWLDAALLRQRLGVTDLILREILQGVPDERRAAETLRALLTLEVFTTGGIELAVEAARNYRRLRAAGFTVRRTADCLIATFCIREGHELLHADRDFDPFEEVIGLRVVHS